MTYIWETLEFEEMIQSALVRDLHKTHGDARFGYYTTARKHLLEDVLEEIKRIQPNMTDHGPRHIRDVLQNMRDLLGTSVGDWDNELKTLTEAGLNGVELYILGLSALFHDVGNVFERDQHQIQIAPIYDLAMPNNGGNQDVEQKQLVLDICKAHCGEGFDGSKNTLQFVSDRSKIERKEIHPNMLAPILRFADELAEGEQRTSRFMIKQHEYPNKSIQFHRYAVSSNVDIDRAHGRIRLKYHITLRLPQDPDNDSSLDHGPVISTRSLKPFLAFVYRRIEKVNQERQYAKHYCSLLAPFKETSASFVFWYKKREIPVGLPPVMFSDLVVPGDPQKGVVERNSEYKQVDLIRKLSVAIETMNDQNGEDHS